VVTLSDDDADEDDDEWQSVVLLLAVRFSMLLLLLLRVKLTSPLIDYAANHTQTQRLDTTRYDKLSALKKLTDSQLTLAQEKQVVKQF